MPSDEDVSDFTQATFRSVWALELLCFLRQDRSRGHSHEDMVRLAAFSLILVSIRRKNRRA